MGQRPLMDRRATIAALLALTVALAGCQFGGPGTTANGPADGTETASPAPFAGVSTPPGVDETGVTDVGALMDSHASTLNGTSATVSIDFRLAVNGSARNVSLTGKTTPDGDRGWMAVELEDGTGIYYTEDGTTYYRQIVNESVQYGTTDRVSAIPDRLRFGADGRIRTAIESAEWEPTGTVERDGRTLLEFRATSVDPPNVNTSGDTTVTSDGRLLVDTDGVVHHVSVSTTVENDRGTVEYGLTVTVSEVGNTTIERPEWYDNAA